MRAGRPDHDQQEGAAAAQAEGRLEPLTAAGLSGGRGGGFPNKGNSFIFKLFFNIKRR